jgi:hypothetical protein
LGTAALPEPPAGVYLRRHASSSLCSWFAIPNTHITIVTFVPVFEVFVGVVQGEIPLRKLQKHLAKLPKKLSGHQMRELRARLKAVGGLSMPIPKGPMPKGIRVPKR